ncbi:MAG TPA: holo-ACP synthase [Ohtaekwangia sp.]|nr:holo-ACP synthase [Ohtaekwangia sp.]
MIIGTGIDLVEVERIEAKLRKENGFREKVFSKKEIAYCESQTNMAQHFAARFAAKEAFLKAIGQGLQAGYELCELEIVVDTLGKPSLNVRGTFLNYLPSDRPVRIHVSMSHLQTVASAVVIVET